MAHAPQPLNERFVRFTSICDILGACRLLHMPLATVHNFPKRQVKSMNLFIFLALLSGICAAPFMKEDDAKRFIRLKRQSGYWDPNHSQNQWGYTVQEQANEYWTALRTDAQYYMDMGNLMFDRAVAAENNKLYMEMLRNARAHLDAQTGRH